MHKICFTEITKEIPITVTMQRQPQQQQRRLIHGPWVRPVATRPVTAPPTRYSNSPNTHRTSQRRRICTGWGPPIIRQPWDSVLESVSVSASVLAEWVI